MAAIGKRGGTGKAKPSTGQRKNIGQGVSKSKPKPPPKPRQARLVR